MSASASAPSRVVAAAGVSDEPAAETTADVPATTDAANESAATGARRASAAAAAEMLPRTAEADAAEAASMYAPLVASAAAAAPMLFAMLARAPATTVDAEAVDTLELAVVEMSVLSEAACVEISLSVPPDVTALTDEMYAATATTPEPADGCAIGVRETEGGAAVGVSVGEGDVENDEPGERVSATVGLADGDGLVEGESDAGSVVTLGVLEGESVGDGVIDGDVPTDCDDDGVVDDDGVGDAVSVDVAVAVGAEEGVSGEEPVADASALMVPDDDTLGEGVGEPELRLEGVMDMLSLAVFVGAAEAEREEAADATGGTETVPDAAAVDDDVNVGEADGRTLDDVLRDVVARTLRDGVGLSLCDSVARPLVDGLPLGDTSGDGVEDADADLDPPRMVCEAIV